MRRDMKNYLLLYIILVFAGVVSAQTGLARRQADQLYDRGDNFHAMEAYKNLLNDNPNDPELNYNAGNALYRLEQYDEAVKFYQRALENTSDADLKNKIAYNMANIQYKQKKLKESIEGYKNVLRKNPDDADARKNLEYALKQMQMQQPPPQKNQDKNQSKQDKKEQDQKNQDDQNQPQDENKEEQQNDEQQNKKKSESYSTGIVLAGFISFNYKEKQGYYGQASDRFIQALRLYKLGHIKKILITGGSGSLWNQQYKEADFVKEQLLEFGIPPQDIIAENQSKNTFENAVNTKKILDSLQLPQPYLLITSASSIN